VRSRNNEDWDAVQQRDAQFFVQLLLNSYEFNHIALSLPRTSIRDRFMKGTPLFLEAHTSTRVLREDHNDSSHLSKVQIAHPGA